MRPTIRQRLGYRDDDHVIVFVANEYERKGFGPLLRAIAKLADPKLKLLAVGRLDPSTYAAEIGALGMTDRVRIQGPTKDVWQYYAAADAFVSSLKESSPVLTHSIASSAQDNAPPNRRQ